MNQCLETAAHVFFWWVMSQIALEYTLLIGSSASASQLLQCMGGGQIPPCHSFIHNFYGSPYPSPHSCSWNQHTMGMVFTQNAIQSTSGCSVLLLLLEHYLSICNQTQVFICIHTSQQLGGWQRGPVKWPTIFLCCLPSVKDCVNGKGSTTAWGLCPEYLWQCDVSFESTAYPNSNYMGRHPPASYAPEHTEIAGLTVYPTLRGCLRIGFTDCFYLLASARCRK